MRRNYLRLKNDTHSKKNGQKSGSSNLWLVDYLFIERRDIPGSTAFVPAVAGLLMAGEIVKDLSRGEDSLS